jgi:hypothetical protein
MTATRTGLRPMSVGAQGDLTDPKESTDADCETTIGPLGLTRTPHSFQEWVGAGPEVRAVNEAR